MCFSFCVIQNCDLNNYVVESENIVPNNLKCHKTNIIVCDMWI